MHEPQLWCHMVVFYAHPHRNLTADTACTAFQHRTRSIQELQAIFHRFCTPVQRSDASRSVRARRRAQRLEVEGGRLIAEPASGLHSQQLRQRLTQKAAMLLNLAVSTLPGQELGRRRPVWKKRSRNRGAQKRVCTFSSTSHVRVSVSTSGMHQQRFMDVSCGRGQVHGKSAKLKTPPGARTTAGTETRDPCALAAATGADAG